MECATCLERGRHTDGGDLGRCRACLKKKCRNFPICGQFSAGREICARCELANLEADIRTRAIDPLEFQPRLDALDLRARKALVWESSRFLIEAALCVRRAMLLHLDAFYDERRRHDDTGSVDKAA